MYIYIGGFVPIERRIDDVPNVIGRGVDNGSFLLVHVIVGVIVVVIG